VTFARTIEMAGLSLLLTLSAGCSFFMKSAPDRPFAVDQEISCTSYPAAPIVDAAIAAPSLVFGLANVIGNAGKSCPANDFCGPRFGVAVGATLLAVSVVYGLSSINGFRKALRCKEAIDDQLGCRQGNVAACQKLQGVQPPSGNRDGSATGGVPARITATEEWPRG
jgi:hypothetical protein